MLVRFELHLNPIRIFKAIKVLIFILKFQLDSMKLLNHFKDNVITSLYPKKLIKF